MIDLGTFKVGEKPLPTPLSFLDGSGRPLNLTGYSARYVVRAFEGGTAAERALVTVVDAPAGKVHVNWDPTDFGTAGLYVADVWVGNLTNRLASRTITYKVEPAVGPAPAI